MQLTYTVLKREGDLRFNLVRTRENSGEATALQIKLHVIFRGCGLATELLWTTGAYVPASNGWDQAGVCANESDLIAEAPSS
jgi:hypothetical protein